MSGVGQPPRAQHPSERLLSTRVFTCSSAEQELIFFDAGG